MLDFVGKRYWYFALSLLVIIPGAISLIFFGLNRGIEFTSGTTMTVSFTRPVGEAELRQEYSTQGYSDAIIQHIVGANDYFVRTRELTSDDRTKLDSGLKAKFAGSVGDKAIIEFASVSPIVAAEIEQNAIRAVIAAAVGILLYITFAFRKVAKPFRYGACAIIAMIHDILVVLGIFSLLGKFAGVEIDALFIAGVLTVVGYSVHDTIVVFDRIRENSLKGKIKEFPAIVNVSIMETMARSLNTGLTTLFVIVALFLFGGITIHYFVLTLLIGIVTGTYSSIFNAAQLLVVWENKEWGKFISWVPGLGSLGNARAK